MSKATQLYFAAIILTIPLLLLLYFLAQPEASWQAPAFHFYYVVVSAVIAFIIACFAYREYDRTHQLKIYLLAIGFVGISVLYYVHALITPGKSIVQFPSMQHHINAFVFFGDMSRLWVSLFFIPQTFIADKSHKRLTWVPLAMIAVVLIGLSIFMLQNPDCFPNIKHSNGLDTHFAVITKVITVVFLVITVARYYEGWRILPNPALMSLITGVSLLSQTPVVFLLSKPWGQTWWLAHHLYLFSFIIIGLGLLYSRRCEQIRFFDVFKQIEETMNTIEQQKAALELANKQLIAKSVALEKMAFIDNLTGAFNRQHFDSEANREIDRVQRYRHRASVILIDIDHFKIVNDTYGHDAGDQVLIELVQAIQDNIRTSDVLARWGGEEFVILTPYLSCAEAGQFAEKLRALIDGCLLNDKHVTISLGVAECHETDTVKSWVMRADKALYQAKAAGRNKVVCYNG